MEKEFINKVVTKTTVSYLTDTKYIVSVNRRKLTDWLLARKRELFAHYKKWVSGGKKFSDVPVIAGIEENLVSSEGWKLMDEDSLVHEYELV